MKSGMRQVVDTTNTSEWRNDLKLFLHLQCGTEIMTSRTSPCSTFEDVLAASQYLHEQKIAAKGKIILNGGSNGGLTVMASLNMCTDQHGIGAGGKCSFRL